MFKASVFLLCWGFITFGWCRFFPWEFGWKYWRHIPFPIKDGELCIIVAGFVAGLSYFCYEALVDET